MQATAVLSISHQLALDEDPACADGFELIDAAEQSRLAGAGGTYDNADFAGSNGELDPREDLHRPEEFVNAVNPDSWCFRLG